MSMPQLYTQQTWRIERRHLSLEKEANSAGTLEFGAESREWPAGQHLRRAIEGAATSQPSGACSPATIAQGEMIPIVSGTGGLVYLLSGMLKVTVTTADGRRSILKLCLPGDVTPYAAVPTGSGTQISFVAVTASRVTTLQENQISTLLEDPNIALELLGLFAKEIRASHDRSTRLKLEDGHVRAAATICGLAERLGQRFQDRIVVQHPLTHRELAYLSGLTRETFGRALSGLIARRWLVTDRQTFTILDEGALRRRARLSAK